MRPGRLMWTDPWSPAEHEAASQGEPHVKVPRDEPSDLLGALLQDFLSTFEQTAMLHDLQRELVSVRRRVGQMEEESALIVPVQSLTPQPLAVVKPFQVVVRAQDEGYVATFFDANLSASGDTREEAVANLKDIIAGVYQVLISHEEHQLGPGPAKQLQVLKDFIAPRS